MSSICMPLVSNSGRLDPRYGLQTGNSPSAPFPLQVQKCTCTGMKGEVAGRSYSTATWSSPWRSMLGSLYKSEAVRRGSKRPQRVRSNRTIGWGLGSTRAVVLAPQIVLATMLLNTWPMVASAAAPAGDEAAPQQSSKRSQPPKAAQARENNENRTTSQATSDAKPGKPSKRRGRRVMELDEDEFEIFGELEKPSAYYVLQRSSIDHDWSRIDARFTPLVLESVQDPLF